MGFDNECILNIQSLAGEYFCPVCRLLVYPNEALQSQCTHLYCKPCLTYIVSTTRACPYDGYLVTEADSKPLTESNKPLAETIGKINVHCLYHRSGCMWQGPLSECTTHCSGCAFGNSPVVCNRCAVQIVHRQVQEHAQNCPGVQMQAQPAGVSQSAPAVGTAAAAGNQTQVVTAMTAPQAQPSGAATSSLAAQAPNQQPSATAVGVATAAAPTAEQWYQQQQQYQQYYQQYPGYDPYQQQYQQYYAYPQQAVPQYQPAQPQAQPSAQTLSQPQAQPHVQPLVAAQPQNPAQVNLPQQTYPPMQPQLHTHAAPYGHPQPQPQPQSQSQSQSQSHLQTFPVQPQPQNLQIPQYQQPFPQVQQAPPQTQVQVPLQPQVHSQPQAQAVLPHPQPLAQPVVPQPNQAQVPSALAVTGHHSYPQAQPLQQIQLGAPQNPVHMRPQSGPQPQLQLPAQSQLPPQPALLRPPQQLGLLPSPVQVSALPTHPQPVQSHTLHPGLPVHQQPAQPVQQPMQPVQQPMHQQYAQFQQPYPGQPSGPVQPYLPQQGPYLHQQHLQPQLHPQGPAQSFPQNVVLPQGLQPHQAQSQTSSGWPMVPPHGALAHAYTQSTAGMQVRPMHVANQQSGNILRTGNQLQVLADQKSGHISGELSDRQGSNTELPYQKADKNDPSNPDVASAPGSAVDAKSIKTESDLKTVENGDKPMGDAKDIRSFPVVEGGDHFSKQVKEEPLEGKQKDVPSVGHGEKELFLLESKEIKDGPSLKIPSLEAVHHREPAMKMQDILLGHGQGQSGNSGEQGKQQLPPTSYGPSGMQVPFGPSSLQAPPPGPLEHSLVPGYSSAQLRPFGGQTTHSGQPLIPPAGILQQQAYKQPLCPENLAGGIPGSGPTSAFVKGPSGYGPQHGPSTQGHMPPSHGERTPSEMFPDQRSTYSDGRHAPPGQHFGMQSNAMRMNGQPLLDSSLAHGLRDDRFRSLAEPFTEDPSRHQREFEDGFKHFSRPSQIEPPRFGPHFSASGPLERGPPSFDMDVVARPSKGLHGPSYDSRLKVDPLGGPRPFPPYHHDGTLHPTDLGGRPTGFRETGRSDSVRAHLGPVPGYGHRHMDGLVPRSPGLDHPGIPSRLFGAFPGGDDIDGQESRQFTDPLSNSLHDNRFSVFPGHFRRGEFEASGMRPGDYKSSGEHLGSRIMHNQPRLRDGFGAFGDHMQMGELGGIGPGNFRPPRFGEPGFRSSFTQKGFQSDGGRYTGDIDTFDNSRRKKPSSMGWCRICKVDCETVEGLDLHSQTKEHQKMAMDMVLAIKQNAKKQKIAVGGKPALDDSSNMRSANSEGHGSKH